MNREEIIENIKKNKKIIIIVLLIGIGFIPFFFIKETVIKDWENHVDNLPYEYSQTGEEGYICVFPAGAIYSNREIHWMFNATSEVKLVFMNDENYYKYEKLSYYRTNGDIHINLGNWLALVDYYTASSGKESDEGYWHPSYLDWWCLVFVEADTNYPLTGVGSYGYGYNGVNTVINVELSFIISGIYFASIVIIYFLNKRYELKRFIIKKKSRAITNIYPSF